LFQETRFKNYCPWAMSPGPLLIGFRFKKLLSLQL